MAASGAYAGSMSKDQLGTEVVYRVNLGRADDVKILLDEGASPDQVNDDGVPLISLACAREDAEGSKVLEVLIKAGANIHAQDPQGKTALFYAAKKGNGPAVKLLLDNKINYYAIDNRGDIARTVAFREGHNDIVDTLDAFVHEQTIKVNKEYDDAKAELSKRYEEQRQQAEERNKQIIESQEKMQEQQRELAEEAKQKAEEAKKKAEEDRKKIEEMKQKTEEEQKKSEEIQKEAKKYIEETQKKAAEKKAAEDTAEEKTVKAPDDAADSELAPKMVAKVGRARNNADVEKDAYNATKEMLTRSQDLAFHSCALEYWYYCREANQPMEMDEYEVNEAIDTEKDTVIDMKAHISAMNPNPPEFPEILAARAKKMIFDQLSGYPSRRMRRDNGVGTLQDMKKRCDEISQQWQIVPASDKQVGEMADKDEKVSSGKQSYPEDDGIGMKPKSVLKHKRR